MSARVPLFLSSLVCFFAIACAPAEQAETAAPAQEPVSTEADEAAIREVMDRWTEYLNTESTDGMMRILTENTNHMGPNEPMLIGQADVRAWFDAIFEPEGAAEFTITTAEVRVAGDWAVGRGSYTSTAPDESGEPATVPGKWVIIFDRGADGAWRAASTIWNIDVPVEAQ